MNEVIYKFVSADAWIRFEEKLNEQSAKNWHLHSWRYVAGTYMAVMWRQK